MLESDGLGEGGAVFLMTRLVKIFLFLVGTRGAALPKVCLRLEADWGESGRTVIITFFIGGDPLQKRTSGRLGESGMAPSYLSWVLDHLVAASKVSKVSQEKWERA